MRFFDRRGATSLSVSGSEFHDPNLGMVGNPEIMAKVLVNAESDKSFFRFLLKSGEEKM